MIRFKEFLVSPINASVKGYEACFLDCIALVCSWVSFQNAKQVINDWHDLLKETTLINLPAELALVLLSTILYASLPFLFWVYGIFIYLRLPYVVKRRRKLLRRIDENLSK